MNRDFAIAVLAAAAILSADCRPVSPASAGPGAADGEGAPDAYPASVQPPEVEPCEHARPEMVCIPGGWFVRGTDGEPKNARPEQKVWVQTFYIDRYEVTVRRFEACVEAGNCDPAETNYSDFSRSLQPKNGVSWFDARAYCRAQGERLPTEAEWEKAARGTDGRTYPWGEEPATCERAVIKNAEGRSCGVEKSTGKHEVGRTFAVGSRPPNQYGLYDMAGNSWEWVLDWASESYADCGEACRGVDPRGPCDGESPCAGHHRRVVRGGSWYWPGPQARTFYRRFHFPDNDPYHHFGFRCASSDGR
jgi:formylglycine-generating enzyme required for sulfatase activity